MNNDPRNISAYTHSMLVEQVMAIHGRGSADPKTYRRILESMGAPALRRAIEENDFPVPSLTENAGVIASADIGLVPGSARECIWEQMKSVELCEAFPPIPFVSGPKIFKFT